MDVLATLMQDKTIKAAIKKQFLDAVNSKEFTNKFRKIIIDESVNFMKDNIDDLLDETWYKVREKFSKQFINSFDIKLLPKENKK